MSDWTFSSSMVMLDELVTVDGEVTGGGARRADSVCHRDKR